MHRRQQDKGGRSRREGLEAAVLVGLEVADLRLHAKGFLLFFLLGHPLSHLVQVSSNICLLLQVLDVVVSVVLFELQISVFVEPEVIMRKSRVDLDHHQMHLLLLEDLLIELKSFQFEAQLKQRWIDGHKRKRDTLLCLAKRSDFPGQFMQSFADSFPSFFIQTLPNNELSVHKFGKQSIWPQLLLNHKKILYLFASYNYETTIVVQHNHYLLQKHDRVLEVEQVNSQTIVCFHFFWFGKGSGYHFLGGASEKDEFIAPLRDVHLKRKVLVVESIATYTRARTQLIVSNQVIEPALQGSLAFVLHVLLQSAEEVYEIELEEGIEEGKELGVGDLYRLFQEVREGLLCMLVSLRHVRVYYQFSEVLKSQSFVPSQQTSYILRSFCLNVHLNDLKFLKLDKDRAASKPSIDAIKLLPHIALTSPLHS